jgi:uncharacterized protein (TIGR00251 family)
VDGPTKVALRVSPGARRGAVVGKRGAVWKVRVAAPPVDGRANDALVQLLAETLDLPRRDVEIVSGHGGRDKIVALAGIGPAEIEQRLASATVGMGKERE